MMKEKNYTKKCSPKSRAVSWLIPLLVVVILIQSTSAQEDNALEEFGVYRINSINIQVYADGFVDVEIDMEVNNTIAGIFTPEDIQDILIQDSKGNSLQYDPDPVDDHQLLTFYLRTPDERNIRLKYRTLDLTSKVGSMWTFNFSTTSAPGRTIVKIDFPRGSDVLSLRPKDILRSPKNLTTSMLLYPQSEEFSFEYDYRVNPLPDSGYDDLYIIAAIILPLLFLLVFVYLAVRKGVIKGFGKIPDRREVEGVKEEAGDIITVPGEEDGRGIEISHIEDVTLIEGVQSRKIKSSVLNMLEENEKKVLEIIEKADDEITQAYIYKTTGIPKATLSDLMKRLEKRNIIYRRKEGRTNWIKLQEWVFNE